MVQFSLRSITTQGDPLFVGFTDSDWDSDPNDPESTVGYVFILGSRPITWACKKKGSLALSFIEGEYCVALQDPIRVLF